MLNVQRPMTKTSAIAVSLMGATDCLYLQIDILLILSIFDMKYNQCILLPFPPPLIGFPLDRVLLAYLSWFSARTV